MKIRPTDLVKYIGIAFGPLQLDKVYRVEKVTKTAVFMRCMKTPTDMPLIVPKHEVRPFMRLYRRAA